ncbi:hypothetical protein LTR09_001908 [Extremus antarcticus]|uniref:Uncharacterized protein n=1 Tax=Extremus antarcticus TaxID=702011 RepID=A0AAJ0GG38_9PEZI|nr:hypothetical protein LTR09_001908 [Extremus antarcticus]
MIDDYTPNPLTSEHAFIPSRPPPSPHPNQREADRREAHREGDRGLNHGTDQRVGRDSDIPSYYGGLSHSRSSQDITAAASALPDVALDPGPSTEEQIAEKDEEEEKKRKMRRLWVWIGVVVGIVALVAVVVGVVMGVRGRHGDRAQGGAGVVGSPASTSSLLSSSSARVTISVNVPLSITTFLSPQPASSAGLDIPSLLSSTGTAAFTISQDFGPTTYSIVAATTLVTMGTISVTTTVSAPAAPLGAFTESALTISDTFTPTQPPKFTRMR